MEDLNPEDPTFSTEAEIVVDENAPVEKDWTELYIFLCVMGVQLIVLIIVCCCCSCYMKNQAAHALKVEEEKKEHALH